MVTVNVLKISFLILALVTMSTLLWYERSAFVSQRAYGVIREESGNLINFYWHTRSIGSNSSPNMDDWSFTKTSHCPKLAVEDDDQRTLLQRITLHCSEGIGKLVTSWTNTTRHITSVKFGDPCLGDFIQTFCTDDNLVPNVVHYVWYVDKEMDFYEFVSFISVIRFVRPCLILIHGGNIPHGKYWDYVIKRSPNIIHVNRTRPLSIFGQTLRYRENSGDIMRIEALLKYGGIYLDTDTILVRSVDRLRVYDFTLSRQAGGTIMGSAFIMSKKNASFLQLWYQDYHNYNNRSYMFNAMIVPGVLAKKNPSLIHIEKFTIARPEGFKGKKVYKENCNWSSLYGLHLCKRLHAPITGVNAHMTESIIRTFNNTVGSMCRYILYGIKEVCA